MSEFGGTSGITLEYYTYVQRYNMAICGALAAFVYEILITWNDEVQYAWKSVWSIPKCLFLTARYFTLVLLLGSTLIGVTRAGSSPAFCRVFNAVSFLCIVIVGFLCDGLLLMRVIALFHQRKWLCRALYSLYALAYIVEVILSGLDLYTQTRGAFNPGILLDCSSTASRQEANVISALATLPVLLFNALMFALTLVHLLPYWGSRSARGTNVLTLFLTQGTVYFAITFAAFLLETVFSLEALSPILGPWLVLVPIASSRLFLSLRKEAGGVSREVATEDLPPSALIIVVSANVTHEDAEGHMLHDMPSTPEA